MRQLLADDRLHPVWEDDDPLPDDNELARLEVEALVAEASVDELDYERLMTPPLATDEGLLL